MCWNKDISLNTFIFSTIGLVFIYYTNNYTKYKIKWFNNIYMYLFYFSFISMQLVEYFLWGNINNKEANAFYSKMGLFLIIIQPFLYLMSITDIIHRNQIVLYYLIVVLIFFIYKYLFDPIILKTTVADNGHLQWNWLPGKGFDVIFMFAWMFFFVYKLYYIRDYFFLVSLLFIIFMIYLYYLKSNTWGSMWCWAANTVMIYLIIEILLIQPFIEYGSLC